MLHFFGRIMKALRLFSRTRSRGRLLIAIVLALVAYGTIAFAWFEADGALAELTSNVDRLQTSAWWTIVTMTTVGYGDVFPKTWEGRWLVGVPLLFFGIGVLGYALGVLTTAVIDRHGKETRGLVPYTKTGHILICNCPSVELVLEVARELRSDPACKGRDLVLATDAFDQEPQELLRAEVFFVAGNPCREAVLAQANLAGAHRVMILTQNPRDAACDSVTLGVLVTIRALRPEVYVVAECQQSENIKLLRAARADEIVNASGLRAELIAQGLTDPGLNAVVEELLSRAGGHQFYVHALTGFRGTYGALAEQLVRGGKHLLLGLVVDGRHQLMPDPQTTLAPGHRVLVIGEQRPAGI